MRFLLHFFERRSECPGAINMIVVEGAMMR